MANNLINPSPLKTSPRLDIWEDREEKLILLAEPVSGEILFTKSGINFRDNYKPVDFTQRLSDYPAAEFKGNINLDDIVTTYDNGKVSITDLKEPLTTLSPVPTATEVNPITYELWKYDFTSKNASLSLTNYNQYIVNKNGEILFYKPQGYTQEYLIFQPLKNQPDLKFIKNYENYKRIIDVTENELLKYNQDVQNDQKKELDALGAAINKRVVQPRTPIPSEKDWMKFKEIDYEKINQMKSEPLLIQQQPIASFTDNTNNRSYSYKTLVSVMEKYKPKKKIEPIPDATKRPKRRFDLD